MPCWALSHFKRLEAASFRSAQTALFWEYVRRVRCGGAENRSDSGNPSTVHLPEVLVESIHGQEVNVGQKHVWCADMLHGHIP